MGILEKHKGLQRAIVIAASVGLVATGLAFSSAGASATSSQVETTLSRAGLAPGQIKHVWLIILENKSYDATFTSLNQNSYLWKTLPAQGALLKNYYGTGHFSLDNYTSMVSGQGPAPADQNDCPVYADAQGSVVTSHAATDGPTTDRGQFAETGAP